MADKIVTNEAGKQLIFAGGQWRPYQNGNVFNADDNSWFPAGDPTQGQPQQPQGPQLSAFDSAVQGGIQGATMGFGDEILAGGAAAYDYVANRTPEQSWRDSYGRHLGTIREYRDAATQQHPVASGVADLATSVAGGIGAARAIGNPRGWAGSMGYGAGEGAVQGLGRADDLTASGLVKDLLVGSVFGLGGHMVGEGIGKLVRSKDMHPNAPRMEQADDLRIKLTPAQKYNDPALHKVEASMRADPGYSQAFEELDAHNQTRANQILSGQWGHQTDIITEAETKQLNNRISDMFTNAESRGEMIPLDSTWLQDLTDLGADYTANLGKRDIRDPVLTQAAELTHRGDISPKMYQQFYSGLGKDMDGAAKAGNYHEAKLYGGIRKALDNVVDRTTTGLSKDFQDARDLYKIQKLAEKPGVLDVGTGNVSPLSLANQLNRSDKSGYFYGNNETELYNLARLAKSTRSGIGDSGTATRNKTMIDYLLAGPKAEIGNMYMSGPVGTAMTSGPTQVGRKMAVPTVAAAASMEDQIKALEEELGMLP